MARKRKIEDPPYSRYYIPATTVDNTNTTGYKPVNPIEVATINKKKEEIAKQKAFYNTGSIQRTNTDQSNPEAFNALTGMTNKQFTNTYDNEFIAAAGLTSFPKSIKQGIKIINNIKKYPWKLNPFAFKPKEDAYYRLIGEEGYSDALSSGLIRPAQSHYSYGQGNVGLVKNNYPLYDDVYFSKGQPFDKYYSRYLGNSGKSGYAGPYMIEYTGKDIPLTNEGIFSMIDNKVVPSSIYTSDEFPLQTKGLNIYKENKLSRYKKIKSFNKGGNIGEPDPFKSQRNWLIDWYKHPEAYNRLVTYGKLSGDDARKQLVRSNKLLVESPITVGKTPGGYDGWFNWHKEDGKETANAIVRNPTNFSTAIHEAQHMSRMIDPFKDHINTAINNDSKFNKIKSTLSDEDKTYYSDPDEVYSRIMELRYNNNLKPGQMIDKKLFDYIKNNDGKKDDNELFKYYDDSTIIKLLNTLADNSKPQGVARGGRIDKDPKNKIPPTTADSIEVRNNYLDLKTALEKQQYIPIEIKANSPAAIKANLIPTYGTEEEFGEYLNLIKSELNSNIDLLKTNTDPKYKNKIVDKVKYLTPIEQGDFISFADLIPSIINDKLPNQIIHKRILPKGHTTYKYAGNDQTSDDEQLIPFQKEGDFRTILNYDNIVEKLQGRYPYEPLSRLDIPTTRPKLRKTIPTVNKITPIRSIESELTPKSSIGIPSNMTPYNPKLKNIYNNITFFQYSPDNDNGRYPRNNYINYGNGIGRQILTQTEADSLYNKWSSDGTMQYLHNTNQTNRASGGKINSKKVVSIPRINGTNFNINTTLKTLPTRASEPPVNEYQQLINEYVEPTMRHYIDNMTYRPSENDKIGIKINDPAGKRTFIVPQNRLDQLNTMITKAKLPYDQAKILYAIALNENNFATGYPHGIDGIRLLNLDSLGRDFIASDTNDVYSNKYAVNKMREYYKDVDPDLAALNLLRRQSKDFTDINALNSNHVNQFGHDYQTAINNASLILDQNPEILNQIPKYNKGGVMKNTLRINNRLNPRRLSLGGGANTISNIPPDYVPPDYSNASSSWAGLVPMIGGLYEGVNSIGNQAYANNLNEYGLIDSKTGNTKNRMVHGGLDPINNLVTIAGKDDMGWETAASALGILDPMFGVLSGKWLADAENRESDIAKHKLDKQEELSNRITKLNIGKARANTYNQYGNVGTNFYKCGGSIKKRRAQGGMVPVKLDNNEIVYDQYGNPAPVVTNSSIGYKAGGTHIRGGKGGTDKVNALVPGNSVVISDDNGEVDRLTREFGYNPTKTTIKRFMNRAIAKQPKSTKGMYLGGINDWDPTKMQMNILQNPWDINNPNLNGNTSYLPTFDSNMNFSGNSFRTNISGQTAFNSTIPKTYNYTPSFINLPSSVTTLNTNNSSGFPNTINSPLNPPTMTVNPFRSENQAIINDIWKEGKYEKRAKDIYEDVNKQERINNRNSNKNGNSSNLETLASNPNTWATIGSIGELGLGIYNMVSNANAMKKLKKLKFPDYVPGRFIGQDPRYARSFFNDAKIEADDTTLNTMEYLRRNMTGGQLGSYYAKLNADALRNKSKLAGAESATIGEVLNRNAEGKTNFLMNEAAKKMGYDASRLAHKIGIINTGLGLTQSNINTLAGFTNSLRQSAYQEKQLKAYADANMLPQPLPGENWDAYRVRVFGDTVTNAVKK